jgi:hypothetical protein
MWKPNTRLVGYPIIGLEFYNGVSKTVSKRAGATFVKTNGKSQSERALHKEFFITETGVYD